MRPTEIVVGTDGSAASHAAVRWAAREAQRRDLPLRVVFAYDWNWPAGRFGGTEEFREIAQNSADATVADAVVKAKEVAPDLTVHRTAVLGEPAPVLLDAARQAALIVLGSRGFGGFASLLLGSVGQRVATHATCPVAVIRGREAGEGPIVVGVDGSPAAAEALELGFEMAGARGAELVAIRAYVPPEPPWGSGVPPVVFDPAAREAAEHEALSEVLAPWREKYPDVPVEALVARGSPARVLVGVSHTAQLVLVGSRGYGEFAGVLLGSVGMQLLHHSDCPVLIVHS